MTMPVTCQDDVVPCGSLKEAEFRVELPVVLRAPSFQVSGQMTLPNFFSPIGIHRSRVREPTI